MKIDKIKNYNQNLLAVLGTVLLLIAIMGLFLMAIFFISELNRNNYRNTEEGILSDEKIEELQQENKRKQLISYESPRLVDTLNLVYIIPVSHKTLKNEEAIEAEALLDLRSSDSYQRDKRYSNRYYGDFNNILVYDYKNQEVVKLFDRRINFAKIQTEYFEDDILVLFKASTKDTYKDGVINQMDYKTLFIYSLKSQKLREVQWENADVSEFNFVENSKDLIINFGIDHNRDGKFDSYIEPSLIKKYDYANDKLADIVSDQMSKELQMNLEGTKKE